MNKTHISWTAGEGGRQIAVDTHVDRDSADEGRDATVQRLNLQLKQTNIVKWMILFIAVAKIRDHH